MTEYTLEQFQTELKALLVKAVLAGHDIEEVGQTAEDTLSGEWGLPETHSG